MVNLALSARGWPAAVVGFRFSVIGSRCRLWRMGTAVLGAEYEVPGTRYRVLQCLTKPPPSFRVARSSPFTGNRRQKSVILENLPPVPGVGRHGSRARSARASGPLDFAPCPLVLRNSSRRSWSRTRATCSSASAATAPPIGKDELSTRLSHGCSSARGCSSAHGA